MCPTKRSWGRKLDFEVDCKIIWLYIVISSIGSYTPRFSLNTASAFCNDDFTFTMYTGFIIVKYSLCGIYAWHLWSVHNPSAGEREQISTHGFLQISLGKFSPLPTGKLGGGGGGGRSLSFYCELYSRNKWHGSKNASQVDSQEKQWKMLS